MKQIELTRGLVALVDDDDYEYLSQYKWYASKARYTFYPARNVLLENGKRTVIRMHRDIINSDLHQNIDHINGDGLDNRRCNLRIASTMSNQHNRIKHGGNFKYKGISYKSDTKKHWRSRITVDGKEIVLGYFDTDIEAARKYDEAALQYFGEFARPNEYKDM